MRLAFRIATVIAVSAAAVALSGFSCAERGSTEIVWQKRWVYIPGNLYVDENVPRIEGLLRRASAAGYSGVLFSDTKTLTWRHLSEPERWKANAAKVRELATDLGLELVVCVFPFGYSESILARDVNLAAGMPVEGAPLVRRGGRLVPEQTASIANGSFEEFKGNRAAGFGLQDDPGEGSFIDTTIFREGRAAIRFENTAKANAHGLGRLFQRIAVKPWQQYRIRVWMKTERLAADMVQVIVLAGRKPLQYQNLVVAGDKGFRYLGSEKDLTTNWIEQSVTFNSLDNASVIVGAGVWGCTGGAIWWDDLRVDAVPTLNVLRREALPLAITGGSGTGYDEGADFDRVVDPGLGTYRWKGTYDTRHEPPPILVPAGSRIGEGERVELSCYHPAIFGGAQVGCSLDDPGVFALCAEEIALVKETLSPDGYYMSHDEIRCAGWEPSQKEKFRTSGELLAFNIRRCYEIAKRHGGGKPVYVWSDMFDPYHNARGNYYFANNTMSKSWEGLDPGVVVMKWGMADKAAKSLEFFSGRGNRLMIAAFYDEDVEENHAAWMKAVRKAPEPIGVMYTTWRGDYSRLEEFAKAWWGR